MKYLVTGGAGFIGSHLVRSLINEGHEIIVIDDFSNSSRTKVPAGIKIIEASILDISNFKDELAGCDGIFHLAAEVSVPKSFENPFKTLEVNALGTLRILNLMRELKIPKIVYSGTCAVYGDKGEKQINEEMPPEPLSPYAYTKLESEYLIKCFAAIYGIKYINLRYFNVYGEGQDPSSPYSAAIPIFISQIKNNESIKIFGDGNQTRDFISVDDVVKVNKIAMQSDITGETINVGNGKSLTINELLEILQSISQKSFNREYLDRRKGDIIFSKADVTKLKNRLDFSPNTNLKESLSAFL